MLLKVQSTEYDFFPRKQLHLLILCTFSRLGEMGFGESGLNQTDTSQSTESR